MVTKKGGLFIIWAATPALSSTVGKQAKKSLTLRGNASGATTYRNPLLPRRLSDPQQLNRPLPAASHRHKTAKQYDQNGGTTWLHSL